MPPLRTLVAVVAASLGAAAFLGTAAAQEHDHAASPPAEGAPVLTVAAAIETALRSNPDLAATRELASASRARARAAGRMPAPELQGTLWQAPLKDPFDWSEADMLMIGLRQTFPAPGSLSLREEAGKATASARDADADARRQALVADVRKAFAQYAHAVREEAVHVQHMALNRALVDLARVRFESSTLSKRDVLRSTYELSRLHADVASVTRLRRSAAAMLRLLMALPADTPLGDPEQRGPPLAAPDLASLEERAEVVPAVAAASQALAAAEAALSAARREGSWPDLMVGLDYGYGPMDRRQTYTLMLGVPLPWLSGARRDAVVEAERNLAAARRSRESALNAARFEIEDAAARVDAAREALGILDGDLVPQAERSAAQAQADFRTGQADAMSVLEALHTLQSVRLERSRAVLALEEAHADLDRAAGIEWTPPDRGAP
jgi:cobalt-zinc-cadmium efflux system outer membrane protein